MLKLLAKRYSDSEILEAVEALCYTFDGTFGQVLTVAHIATHIEDYRKANPRPTPTTAEILEQINREHYADR